MMYSTLWCLLSGKRITQSMEQICAKIDKLETSQSSLMKVKMTSMIKARKEERKDQLHFGDDIYKRLLIFLVKI